MTHASVRHDFPNQVEAAQCKTDDIGRVLSTGFCLPGPNCATLIQQIGISKRNLIIVVRFRIWWQFHFHSPLLFNVVLSLSICLHVSLALGFHNDYRPYQTPPPGYHYITEQAHKLPSPLSVLYLPFFFALPAISKVCGIGINARIYTFPQLTVSSVSSSSHCLSLTMGWYPQLAWRSSVDPLSPGWTSTAHCLR